MLGSSEGFRVPPHRLVVRAVVVTMLALLGACSTPRAAAPPRASPAATTEDDEHFAATTAPAAAESGESVWVAVAGDIACDPDNPDFNDGVGRNRSCKQRATSNLLLDRTYAAVLTAGDNQYETATLPDFRASYHPSWGRVKAKTYPSLGNHEYRETSAGYFKYFGSGVRGPDGMGWYSVDIGAWHVVMLNTNCDQVRCGWRSPQARWLRRTLGASDASCTLAVGHHPRFSSGEHGSQVSVDTLYRILFNRGVEIYVAGHDHDYERFRPQRPDGTRSPDGVRQFVVGTGGRGLRPFAVVRSHSAVRDAGRHGILALRLRPASYSYRFIGIRGAVHDSGTTSCH